MSARPWRVEYQTQDGWQRVGGFGAYGSTDSAGKEIEKWKRVSILAARRAYRVVNRDTKRIVKL